MYVLTGPFLSGNEYTTTTSNQRRHLRECKTLLALTGGASHSSAPRSHPESNGAVAGDGIYEYGYDDDEHGHGNDEYGHDVDEYGHDDDEYERDDNEYQTDTLICVRAYLCPPHDRTTQLTFKS